ncbi:MAG: Glu/Leu/Phe/Val dehydrogenase, partial [Deltaproteobacteria bacterium]|nr:Glu/Leu/Phe/Val dehydrogenase [Deltaproteobacteria bacterium]
LRTRLVAQGANIPMTAGAELTLHRQGVLVLPDFIANAGGVICGAMEYAGKPENEVFSTISRKIRTNVGRVLKSAAETGVTPREAAVRLAVERVKKAMGSCQAVDAA